MSLSTERRTFLLGTPLGDDVLVIRTMEGAESLSRLFQFKLELISEREDITSEDMVGKRVTLKVLTNDGTRDWTGFVSRFTRMGEGPTPEGMDGTLYYYELEMVPWLWFMLHHEDSRIFLDKSIPDIIEQVFKDFSYSDYELKINGSHPNLVTCTQYQETNFNFISRLMERAGIYYYVRHEEDREVLVLTDNKDSHPDHDPLEIPFHEIPRADLDDGVLSLRRREVVHTGRVVLRDYDFERPTDTLEVSVDSVNRFGDSSGLERYIYGAGYTQRSEGEELARVIIESEEAEQETFDGRSNVRTLSPGYVFKLDGHPERARDEKYLVIQVRHQGTNNIGNAPSHYENRFAVIPYRIQYRAMIRTPKKKAPGLQTAVVVGPAGEEIHTDKHGRIKVQFHWDRNGKFDDKSSCWLRVAQSWAGRQWGTFFLPRIGQEVLVDFIEGDIDRPIVVGSVYNGDNPPPYALPAEATKSTIKTLSSKGGEGFNELRFEDKKGSEEIFIHAEKDLQVRVKNGATQFVGGNENQIVAGESYGTFKKDRFIACEENLASDVGKDESRNVGQNLTHAIGQNHDHSVGMNLTQTVGQNLEIDVGMGTAIKSGMDVSVSGGMKIVMEAGMTLSLKAGPSSVVLGPAGVTIDGPLVRINSGGSPLSAKSPGKAQKPDPIKKAAEAIKVAAGKVVSPHQQTQAAALRNAARQAQPFCAACEAARAALGGR